MLNLDPEEYVDISTVGIDDVPSTPAPLPSPADKATISYWMATTPSQSLPASHHTLPARSDVVIVGSGITGVSTAYHLINSLPATPRADSITSIAIIEARSFCSGATGRNGGHLTAASALAYTDLAANPAHLLGSSYNGIDAADVKGEVARVVEQILTFESDTAKAIRKIIADEDAEEKVGFTDDNNWHMCFNQAEVDAFERSLAEAAEHQGLHRFVEQVRRVPKDEVDRRMNHPSGIVAVYEIPGATLHPRALVSLLFTHAQRLAAAKNISLNLYTDLPVLSVTSANRLSVCSTSKGDIQAKYVVHATNGYASHLLPHLSSSQSGIIATRAQVVAVEPLGGEPLWRMGLSAGGGYEYGHQRPSRESPLYILGGGREHATGREWGVADDTVVNAEVSAFLHPYLAKVFPASYGDKVQSEWTGIMGYTKSKDPLVGPVPWPEAGEARRGKEFIAAGYSGHGMTRAFGCAEVVADMIVAEVTGQRWVKSETFPDCYLTAPAKALLSASKHHVEGSAVQTEKEKVDTNSVSADKDTHPSTSEKEPCHTSRSDTASTSTSASCCTIT